MKVDVPRGGKMDWTPLRAKIAAQGMRNSNVLAIAPTATISNITATSPCIEPTYKNLFVKSNLSGQFIVLNPFMVKTSRPTACGTGHDRQLKYFWRTEGHRAQPGRIEGQVPHRGAFDIDPK